MTSPEVVVVTLLRTLRGAIFCCCGSALRVPPGEPEDVARAHARTFFMAHSGCAEERDAVGITGDEREIARAWRRAGLAGARS